MPEVDFVKGYVYGFRFHQKDLEQAKKELVRLQGEFRDGSNLWITDRTEIWVVGAIEAIEQVITIKQLA
jgi:hypothetical protein